MKLHILSDLHLEMRNHALAPPVTDADVVVLAGDIHRHAEGIAWAMQRFSSSRVIYVAGNHEYYDGDWDRTIPMLRAAAVEAGRDRLSFLEEDALVVDGVRFLGCTLWTDFDVYGEERRTELMDAALRSVVDFRTIGTSNASGEVGRLAPSQVRERHLASARWLAGELERPFAGATVVVTHHLPHRDSIAPRYDDDPRNGAFVSDLSRLMGKSALWIHGHTHNSFDYVASGTRVVCNPRGYPRRDGTVENRRFDPGLTIEV